MNKVEAYREGLSPHAPEERHAILLELEAVVASPHFRHSKRYPALLRHVVENTLAGRSDLLKERTLGVEVFGRPPDYDTNTDTVVRYTAGEVRKRLLLYYSEHDSAVGIRISLPAGSYIPEFLTDHGDPEHSVENGKLHGIHAAEQEEAPVAIENEHQLDSLAPEVVPALLHAPPGSEAAVAESRIANTSRRRLLWVGLAALAAVVLLAAEFGLSRPNVPVQGAMEEFWAPVVHDQRTVMICTGGVVFKENNFSGVVTADKNSEYPFVSMQIASSIVPVSGLVARSGAAAQLLPSPTTPLSELRDHPVILLGGYNNQWTMRLLETQRYYFTKEPVESITDRTQPQVHWSRDRSLPYSSADDYALVARFRDSATGGWVVVLAGLGRNGTEAASQFATSPGHMQALADRISGGFGNRNVEAVLKLQVIDGKTGAPAIIAVHTW